MIELVKNLEAAFAEKIKQLDWMSNETKEKPCLSLLLLVKK
jgi:predicted metalloendopeptidase